ncbi:helix-turn-helix transcriptional regulator [Chishuiella sp.]|uniref:helix-turn-helix domain-containing protein n=1 Tax=Chishuiella sp. TaxID=1969467 RepID=UPI0028A881FB|nr:helix-turn-helix transcriptional regulator [Chishuiella sp.]
MLRIKEILKEKKIKQSEIADAMGITQVGFNKMINGNPTAENLIKISKILDVDVRELFIPTKEDESETIYVQTENGLKPIGEIKKGSI